MKNKNLLTMEHSKPTGQPATSLMSYPDPAQITHPDKQTAIALPSNPGQD